MAEIAILRRVREAQDRERLERAAARWDSREKGALLFGRVLFGGYFLYNGINHLMNRETMVAYAASKRVPYPEAAVVGTGAMLLLGGLSLLTGIRPKFGSSILGAFLVGVTPKMHAFWDIQDPQQRMGEHTNFAKNIGLLGGTLIAAAVREPWPARVSLAR
jgi:putative oxidoreductase